MTDDSGAEVPPARGLLPTDWRVWLGLAIAVAAIAYTLHDVDLAEVGASIAASELWLLPLLIGLQLLGLWIRALRWRYLTRSLAPALLPLGALFRATLVGFMGINLLPLRLGELARAWFLARETGVRGSAVLGTIVLERALDLTIVALVGGCVLYMHSTALPDWVQRGSTAIVVLGFAPLAVILALRVDESATLKLLRGLLRPLPPRLRDRAEDLLTQLCLGLNSLRGLRDTLIVLWESALLWAVVLPAFYMVGLLAFHVDLPTRELVLAAFTAHVFVAVAIAAPAAPGFFGVYHFAAREALTLFGISSTIAVGFGTVLHLTYWVPVTLAGLLAMLQSGAHFGDLTDSSLGKAPSDAHR